MSNLQAYKRHPNVPFRRVELSEERAELQMQRGLFVVSRGERLAIPVDRIREPTTYLNRELWRMSPDGDVYRPGARLEAPGLPWVKDFWKALPPSFRRMRDALCYGHDVHATINANLFARHWHAGWANPFDPDKVDLPLDPAFKHDCDMGSACPLKNMFLPQMGFLETVGWVSGGLVTEVFVNVTVGALADAAASGEAAEFNDFNEHEVGTSSTAESNDHTALQTSSGIALTAGTQTDNGDVGEAAQYETVATITADATESWEEHGIFSSSVDSLMDRSLTGGQSVNSSDQVEYTYQLDVNAET